MWDPLCEACLRVLWGRFKQLTSDGTSKLGIGSQRPSLSVWHMCFMERRRSRIYTYPQPTEVSPRNIYAKCNSGSYLVIVQGSPGIGRPSAQFAQLTSSSPSCKPKDARCERAFHVVTRMAITCVFGGTYVAVMRLDVVNNSVRRLSARSKDIHIGEIVRRACTRTVILRSPKTFPVFRVYTPIVARDNPIGPPIITVVSVSDYICQN